MRHTIRRSSFVATVTGLLALLAFHPGPGSVEAAAEASPEPSPSDELLEPRRREAEMKSRVLSSLRALAPQATPNQLLYDVKSYGLDLTLDPVGQMLSGVVTVVAEVTGASITTMDLDLRSTLSVSATTSGGLAATHSHVSDVLTVNLDQAYTTGQSVTVVVTYGGNPASAAFNWGTHNAQPMIWTLSQPFGARDWWPCKNVTNDKADSVNIVLTVPNTLIAASNGLLLSDVTVGPNRTFHWRTQYPTAPYLVSLAVHPFTILNDTYFPSGGGSMPLVHYLFSDHVTAVSPLLPLTPAMLGAFSDAFGEYPFVDEKYGHAEFLAAAAMEHQTLSSMGFWNESVIAHELAHQWFGDFITCENYSHLWLNEGFASWSEAYWQEVNVDAATYRQYMLGTAYYGPGTVYIEDPQTDNIFDVGLTYNKAGWVVHMLRGVVGDSAFFQGIADYRAAYGFGSATTEQFRDVMEVASGLDLDDFFNQWIYGEFFPEYSMSWMQNVGTLEVTIDQLQTTGLFTMPVELRIFTTTDTTDVTVQHSLASENYAIPVTGTVLNVQLDPDRWILRRNASPLTNPTFDKGILLVNGISWPTYGAEATNAYNAAAFWGTLDISFWDTFDEPAGGYPGTLPAPIGHGLVPADTIGMYSAIIWIGNNFAGDLADWNESPIRQYLEAGGNLLLVTRMGDLFLDPPLADYAGVTWSGDNVSLSACNAVYPGLLNIPYINPQSLNDVFQLAVGPNSTLLFSGTGGFAGTQGFGVHAHPPGGGTFRADGGRLVYLAGRPYRMQYAALSANIEFIMDEFFHEPFVPVAVEPPLARPAIALAAPRPNPSTGIVTIAFDLPERVTVDLGIYDVTGRRVRTLAQASQAAGSHTAQWDGTDAAGHAVAPGTYFVRLQAAGRAHTRGIVRMQ